LIDGTGSGEIVDNRQASQLTTGVLVIAIGVLLLAGQLDGGWHFGRLWPVVLIVIGLGRYVSTDADGRRRSGFWFLFVGGIFLLNNFRVLMLHDSWPLFIVAAGVSIIVGHDRDRWRRGPGPEVRDKVRDAMADLRQQVGSRVVDQANGDSRHDH
jgi:hypothetical protein